MAIRCVRIVWSVSSVSAAVRGCPVRNTQTPRSFCRGVALRLGRNVSSSPCTTRSKVSPGESRSRSRTDLGTTMRPARSRLTVPRTMTLCHGACYWQMALSLAAAVRFVNSVLPRIVSHQRRQPAAFVRYCERSKLTAGAHCHQNCASPSCGRSRPRNHPAGELGSVR